VAGYLSQAWFHGDHDPMAVAAADAGLTLRLQHVVTGGPAKETRYGTVVAADQALETVAGNLSDADLTFTCAFADGLALSSGDITPNTAYMRGRLKAAGHTGLLLQVLAACEGSAYKTASAEVAARTDS